MTAMRSTPSSPSWMRTAVPPRSRATVKSSALRSRTASLEEELQTLGNENGSLREQLSRLEGKVAELEEKLAESESAQKPAEPEKAAPTVPKKRVRARRPVPEGKSVIGAFRRMFDNEREV